MTQKAPLVGKVGIVNQKTTYRLDIRTEDPDHTPYDEVIVDGTRYIRTQQETQEQETRLDDRSVFQE